MTRGDAFKADRQCNAAWLRSQLPLELDGIKTSANLELAKPNGNDGRCCRSLKIMICQISQQVRSALLARSVQKLLVQVKLDSGRLISPCPSDSAPVGASRR